LVIFNYLKGDFDDSVESNDDAEPEAVTFKESKKNILDHVRFALRRIERDKQQTKEKRRKRDTVFKQQKVICLKLFLFLFVQIKLIFNASKTVHIFDMSSSSQSCIIE
jgi:hypothetical protein